MKNIFFQLMVTASLIGSGICYSQTPNLNDIRNLNQEQFAALLEQYRQNPQTKKNPTSPDIIEHRPLIYKGRMPLFRANCIYFGIDAEGKPCYRSIEEHGQNNPDFGSVGIVLFHEKVLYKLRFQDSFEKLGTFGTCIDNTAELRLMAATANGGGLWCPEQNVFIGGTRDTCKCAEFAEYMKQPEQASKLSKI